MPTPLQFDWVNENQKLTKTGGYIELYQLRLESYVSAGVTNVEYINLTPHTAAGGLSEVQANLNGPYQFGQQSFLPCPVQIQNVEVNASGNAPSRPTLGLSVLNPTIVTLMKKYNNFIGMTLIRWKTYTDLLATGSEYWAPYEQYIILMLQQRSKTSASWLLCSWLDRPIQLPAEQVLNKYFPGVPLTSPT